MQFSEETLRYVEHARAARDAAHEFDDNDVSPERADAELAYENAAKALLEQILFEIDQKEGA